MNARLLVLGLPVLLASCGRVGFSAHGDAGDAVDPLTDTLIDAPIAAARGVATGRSHSCAIRAGVLACWGSNASGQLGLGDQVQRLTAAVVDPSSSWIAVGCGSAHTCAVKANGSLWCWGQGASGQLGGGGVGGASDRLVPTVVTLPGPARSVASKFESTCAVLVDGSLWCWGSNSEGQLGQNTVVTPLNEPARVGTGNGWSQVATGQGHVLAIANGAANGTGRNAESELGLGAGAPGQVQSMTLIDAGPWQTISAGQQISMGVRSDGSLWGWGEAFGALGFATTQQRDAPERVDAQLWLDVSIDTLHGCAVLTSGGMRCWGRNVEGQLGRGDMVSSLTPVVSGDAVDWERVAVARFHNCAQRRDGTVWCTGENVMGELGTGDVVRRTAWTQGTLP